MPRRIGRGIAASRTMSEPMSYAPTPAPLSRASLVIGLYGAMAIVAIIVAAGRGDPDLYRLGPSASSLWLVIGPVAGLVVAAIVVALTRVATKRFHWARDLRTSFRDLLGPLTGREILILALASAVGEELLFRGALLPWVGVWWQAIVFALLHVGPGRRFLPWTASALGLGIAFGWLALETHNLGGPIAAHFAINFLNLRYITAAEPARASA